MTKGKKEQVDLLKINVEVGWNCDFHCEDCYRFFECPSEAKNEMYSSVRMQTIRKNLSQVRHILAILSGKGGVGKSTISANLAIALAQRGYRTAVLDSDLAGSSIPSILGVTRAKLKFGHKGIVAPSGPLGIKVVSTAFLLGDDEPNTWRSDLKTDALELFLGNLDYGSLDYLVVDLPSGTGSETVNLLKFIPQISGTLIVTIPSLVSEQVVRRCISLCLKAKAPIVGLIENMSSFVCPECHGIYTPQHSSGEILARETGLSLLGRIPQDPLIVGACDAGESFLLKYPKSLAAANFLLTVDKIEEKLGIERPEGFAETHGDSEPNQLPEILEINVDSSCHEKRCSDCSRYLGCTYPRKVSLLEGGMVGKIREAMSGIRHKIAVMSCKGGVGKSTFAANLAAALASQGKTATVVDCDLHGPCIPRILGVEGKVLRVGRRGIVPVSSSSNVGVLSTAFVLQKNESVTWFDSLKRATVEEFLSYVDYGELDYLIVDLPPGTGAESLAVLQSISGLDGAIIVTIPAQGPQGVVRRSVGLCRQAKVPVIGMVENMSSFVCPHCDSVSHISGMKGGEDLAGRIGVTFLGDIPLDYRISGSCDEGVPFVIAHPESPASHGFFRIVRKIRESVEGDSL